MRLLVTGGAGFLGSTFVRHVLSRTDARVVVLDALSYAGSRSTLADLEQTGRGRVTSVVGDVADLPLVRDLAGQADALVHLAAESHNDRALVDPLPFVHTNLLGTIGVLEAARATGVRLHHVSTDEVFGDLPLEGDEEFDEASPYRPSSPYSATKAGADHLVRAYVRSHGVAATISTSSNCFGPWQHPEKLIPRQITELLDGRPARVYGSGLQVRDWVHAEDHAAALLAILQRGALGETYLVSAGERRTNREIVERLIGLCGRDADALVHVEDRPGHDQRYALDASRLREELGWRPEHDLDSGLETAVAWFREHERWWRPLKDEAEALLRARGH